MNQTTNYSIFRVPANRHVNEHHVSRLVRANKKHNLLDCYPIVVNEKLELFDGQHRLEAAKRLGFPISFIVKEGIQINCDTLLEINSHTRVHSLQDKIDIALMYNDPEALKALECWKLQTRIPITIVFELVCSWGNSSATRNALSNRTFQARYTKEYGEFLLYLEYLPWHSNTERYKGTFVHALAQFWRSASIDMRIKLAENISKLQVCTTRSEYRVNINNLISV